MNTKLSNKLRIISFISILLVVFIHAYWPMQNQDSALLSIWDLRIQNFISQGIARCAVPIFFAISGFLFFIKIEWKVPSFLEKIKKRLKTLLVPYLLWSLFGIVLYYILPLFPMAAPFFTKGIAVEYYSFLDFMNILLWNPIPYQFWFVRDLMFLVLLSPLFYLAYKRSVLFLLAFFALWIADVSLIFISNESVLFFYFGGLLSTKKIALENTLIKNNIYFFFLLWFVFIIFKEYYDPIWFHRIGICIGIITIWFSYDRFVDSFGQPSSKCLEISSLSFFIFAFHEPLLTILKKGSFFLLGSSPNTSLLIYFVSAFSAIIISFFVGFLLKKYCFSFYTIITGGR